MSNGIRSLPRYQMGGPVDPDQEERRRRLWQLMAERRDASEFTPDQEFNINKDRMENLLDSLDALVGGNTSVNRRVSGRPTDYPSGMYIPTEEQAPRNFYQRLVDPLRVREGFPPHINLAAAGISGEGFEMDPSGRPMTGEWSPAERMVAMHEYGHGADLNDILSESLEKMQEKSSAPMYPWHYMGGDEEGGREPPRWRRALRAFESKIQGTYKSEKLATQFGKAVEILQDSLDPERRSEAVSRIDSPEMKELVERLLEHPVYENHPLRQRARP